MTTAFRAFICASFLLAALSLAAQDSLPSSIASSPSPAPLELPTPAPSPFPAPSGAPSLPIAPPNIPELSQLDALFQQSSLGREADDFRLHVEWRKLVNKVVGDPAIIAAKVSAAAAKTDREKRERLRTYYNLFYDRMNPLTSNPALKTYLERKKAGHLASIGQPRVRPSPEAAGERREGLRDKNP